MIINCKEALFFCHGSWGSGSNNGKGGSEESVVSESVSITIGIGSRDGNGGLDGFTGDLGEFFNDLCAFNMFFDVAFGDWGGHIDGDG